jgi:hypothetical protein
VTDTANFTLFLHVASALALPQQVRPSFFRFFRMVRERQYRRARVFHTAHSCMPSSSALFDVSFNDFTGKAYMTAGHALTQRSRRRRLRRLASGVGFTERCRCSSPEGRGEFFLGGVFADEGGKVVKWLQSTALK